MQGNVPDWWEYPSCEEKEFLDQKYLPEYKYCTFCSNGSPKVNHDISECIHQFDPWYEMPYESASEALAKKRKYEQLERLEQGFKPTGFPPTPVSSPKKGAPAFSSFQGQMAILERKLQEHVGPPPRSLDSFRCNICVSDSHTPNKCWSTNPWMCPEWYLKKWINSVSPRVRHPSRTARENHSWRYWVNHIIKDEVWCHSWHYLSTVYDKRQELKTEAEEQIQRQEEPAEPINSPQLCDDKASPHPA